MIDGLGRLAPETRTRLLLVTVLAVAAALRFYRIGNGIPFALGIDEPEILVRAVRIMQTGDFNPHFFDYPSLPIYLHLLVAIARFVVGAATHEFTSLAQADFTDYVMWSRIVTAVLGVATVYVTYRVGLHWSRWHGLLAAAVLAVLPMAVREARFALTDTPMAMLAASALWAALVARERATPCAFAVAAAVAGLAMGMKYTAGLVVLFPLLAVWTSSVHMRVRLWWSVLVVGTWAVAFLVVAPYTVLDLPAFLNGFAKLMGSYAPRPLSEAPWITYLKHIRIAFGWPGVALLIAGLLVAIVHIVRGPARSRWILLVVFPVLHYLVISRQNLVFARYLLPIMPAACLLVASGMMAIVSAARGRVAAIAVRRALMAVFVAGVLAPPAMTSLGIVRAAGRSTTQAEAYEWLEANLRAGESAVIENYVVRLNDSRFRPLYLRRLIEKTFDEHVRSGARYMVATSQMYGAALAHPEQDRGRYEAYMALFTQAKEVGRFSPSADRPGPEVRVFELR